MSAEAPDTTSHPYAGLLEGSNEVWFPRWLGPCSMATAFALLARWSWGKWADIHIDFGSELYIPWQKCGAQGSRSHPAQAKAAPNQDGESASAARMENDATNTATTGFLDP